MVKIILIALASILILMVLLFIYCSLILSSRVENNIINKN